MGKKRGRGARPGIKRPKAPHKRGVRRSGVKLGPMGELGDDIVIDLRPTAFFFQFPNAWKQARSLFPKKITGRAPLSVNIVRGLVQIAIHNPLMKYVEGRIDIDFPMDTGNLRTRTVDYLKDSITSLTKMDLNTPYVVVFGTPDVEYASPVNKMPTAWLQHPGIHGPSVGRTGLGLDDPKSKRGFYNLTLLNGRNRAKRLYDVDFLRGEIVPRIRDFAKAINKSPISVAKRMFRVRFK